MFSPFRLGAAWVGVLLLASGAFGDAACPCTVVEATAKPATQSPQTQPAAQAQPAAQTQPATPRTVLHVWADPDNLPFSNRNGEGFENKIAELVAREMGLKLQYRWLSQRRGFFREALKDGDGDLVIGAPTEIERALTTKPYYRSTYVFVSRKDRHLKIKSFDDPALKKLKIGVQIVGGSATPPAQALGDHGLVDNVVGFPVYGGGSDIPAEKLITAVASGEIDVAMMWGPPAGYYAKRQPVALDVVPVDPACDTPALHFAFDISMGVRRKDKELRNQLNDILARKAPQIQKILDDFGVPHAPAPALQAQQRRGGERG